MKVGSFACYIKHCVRADIVEQQGKLCDEFERSGDAAVVIWSTVLKLFSSREFFGFEK
jgi:hypothetical protein